jgi:hypothetical protein
MENSPEEYHNHKNPSSPTSDPNSLQEKRDCTPRLSTSFLKEAAMKSSGWWIVLLVVLAVGGIVIANWWQNANSKRPIKIAGKNEKPVAGNTAEKKEPIPDDYIISGGIARPRVDIQLPNSTASEDDNSAPVPDPGRVPEIKKDANPYTKSVAEALGKKELAHRLTTMIAPPEFNREEYLKDPKTYLETVEPGRVYQNLEPGPGTSPLKRTSPYFREVLQGETVVLEAKAEPKMPVTFYSDRLGQFQNLLGTISVPADENGVARAEFTVSTGTRDEVEVFAASPVHSGQIRYLIKINLPKPVGGGQTAPSNTGNKS